jgi:hypothetical protein
MQGERSEASIDFREYFPRLGPCEGRSGERNETVHMNFSPSAHLFDGPGGFPLFFIGFERKTHDKIDNRDNPVLMASIDCGHGVTRVFEQ